MATTLTQLAVEDLLAIRRVCEDEWTRVGLKADWDGMVSLLTDDVVFLPPDLPILQGKEAVRVWLDGFPPIKAFKSKEEHTEGRGDLAWSRGTFEMTVEPDPGSLVTMKGKWTVTLRKESDGRWLVASDTWNTDHPLSAA